MDVFIAEFTYKEGNKVHTWNHPVWEYTREDCLAKASKCVEKWNAYMDGRIYTYEIKKYRY